MNIIMILEMAASAGDRAAVTADDRSLSASGLPRLSRADPEWGQRLVAVLVGSGDPIEIQQWVPRTPALVQDARHDRVPRRPAQDRDRKTTAPRPAGRLGDHPCLRPSSSALRTRRYRLQGHAARRRRVRAGPPLVAAVAAGLDPALIDDVVLGESLYGGGDIARYAAIDGRARARRRAGPQPPLRRRAWPPCQTAAATCGPAWTELVIAGGVELGVDLAPFKRRVRHRRVGPTGCRRPTPTGPTRPTWTCRSPSAGTPPSRPA